MNFYELILDVLIENGKSIKDLERNGVLAKDTFYTFHRTDPSLESLINIANFLEVTIDYLLGKSTDDKNCKKYTLNQSSFYNKLEQLRKNEEISQAKLCKNLGISKTNFSRWKNGTVPTISKIIALADYFNCSIDDLLEHEKN